MTPDMSKTAFQAACRRRGFVRLGFGGYYRLAGPRSLHVSVLNTRSDRRAQLAYLIREQEKENAKHPEELHAA